MHELNKNINTDLLMADKAATGDHDSRQQVSELVDGIIRKRTEVLCKKFCYDKKRFYNCTVDRSWGGKKSNAPLCDWGNDSYAWMLDELTSESRLRRYEGRNDASLRHYLSTIAHSYSFFERWKDWRFRRRDRVPTYIQELDKDAAKIFYWLRASHDDIPNIAQRLGRSINEIRSLISHIVAELQKRHKLNLLNPPREISLSCINSCEDDDDDKNNGEWDIPYEDIAIDELEIREQIKSAWLKLDWREQYILDALVIERVNAKHVLQALRDEKISLSEGVTPDKLNIQHIYYFCRKALEKLKIISSVDNG